ncbi:MAG: type IX secretion system sortase PorU, partial [Bacteroidia bacterium]|nr:type IX secretion system sortase PorU [Bacteroidia bacterium]
VQKAIDYVTNPSGFGDWRSDVVFVADWKTNEGIHMNQADQLATKVSSRYSCFNVDKIYLDSYPRIQTSEGARFPAAKNALLDRLNIGSLILNYTGHGSETGWSNARILEINDIANLNNTNRLQFWVTATCEYGRHDDPEMKSGAERLVGKVNSGAIGMFTSVRVVYSTPNATFNSNFYDYALKFDTSLNRYYYLGEIYQQTKNISYINADAINSRNFALLADPGLMLAYPQKQIAITKINSRPITSVPDTIKALQLVRVEGEIRDTQGNKLSNFQGKLRSKIFDKAATLVTYIEGFQYQIQKTRLFNGISTVTNGEFAFEFVVPLDISYEVGNGKFSLYADNQEFDCQGCTKNVIVCCTDTTRLGNDNPPIVELFLNDTTWITGGVTDQNPLLLARIRDDRGINTTGTGVGREIIGVLDGDRNNPYILNQYYQAKLNSYQEGTIEYRMREIPNGEHTLSVKVWDVANNSGTAETKFLVADNANLALEHILNYPNPFTTKTNFFFEHNRIGETLDAQIKIFTLSGKLVKTIQSTFYASSGLTNHIEWDGLDDFGDRIGRGVYVYQLTVKVQRTGEQVSKYEKLVLLR